MDSATLRSAARRRRAPGRTSSNVARFEVRGLDADRGLIRALARRLAEGGPEASRLREVVSGAVAGGGRASEVGGIVAALRDSPLVGSGIDLTRDGPAPRRLDL